MPSTTSYRDDPIRNVVPENEFRSTPKEGERGHVMVVGPYLVPPRLSNCGANLLCWCDAASGHTRSGGRLGGAGRSQWGRGRQEAWRTESLRLSAMMDRRQLSIMLRGHRVLVCANSSRQVAASRAALCSVQKRGGKYFADLRRVRCTQQPKTVALIRWKMRKAECSSTVR